ncbi:MAG: hypothetical protein LUE92_08565 [Clostridiales bacterium]|nr:hypothetical protein [Clostridiales bacterium]
MGTTTSNENRFSDDKAAGERMLTLQMSFWFRRLQLLKWVVLSMVVVTSKES